LNLVKLGRLCTVYPISLVAGARDFAFNPTEAEKDTLGFPGQRRTSMVGSAMRVILTSIDSLNVGPPLSAELDLLRAHGTGLTMQVT
jgi:hypothetical protein